MSGKVYVENELLTSGNVSLFPIDADSKGLLSAGQIKNGEYKIFTNGKEGVPPGKYKITVTPEMKPSPDGKGASLMWDPKYSSPKETTFEIEVKSGTAITGHDLRLFKDGGKP